MALTKLLRPVVRESAAAERGRLILVRLEEGGKLIRFRLKGTRTWFTCTVQSCFNHAVRVAAAEIRRAKGLPSPTERQFRKAVRHRAQTGRDASAD